MNDRNTIAVETLVYQYSPNR